MIIGVTLGAVYAIMAMGLTFVYSVTKIFNYAQGAVFTWGAYVAWMLSTRFSHLPYAVVAIITVLTMFLFGLAFEKALMYPLRRFKDWGMTAIVVTLGAALFLDNLAMVIFGTRPKKLPFFVEGNFTLGEFIITKHEVVTLVAAIAIMVLLALFLGKTKNGIAMRALAQDATGARIVGIPVDKMFSYSFAIAAALGGISGILLAPKILVYPTVGWVVFIKAFVVMVFGGLGSIKGTVVAAFILALVESFVAFYVGAVWGMPVFIVVLVIMLIFRPRGLFGAW